MPITTVIEIRHVNGTILLSFLGVLLSTNLQKLEIIESIRAGMSLMLVMSGIFGILVGLSSYLFPVIREVEKIVPDHDSN